MVVGTFEAAEVGLVEGVDDGAGEGSALGLDVGAWVGDLVGTMVGSGDGAWDGTWDGAAVVPMHTPAEHIPPSVAESPSSHVVPSGKTWQRPVAWSQLPEGTMHGLLGAAEHPISRQSPILMSSRAKSPV